MVRGSEILNNFQVTTRKVKVKFNIEYCKNREIKDQTTWGFVGKGIVKSDFQIWRGYTQVEDSLSQANIFLRHPILCEIWKLGLLGWIR